ncbi:7962_t:CDS:2 [Racocetra fulgida]|uniref:7962_t:CDS:1 n=1 Tax=Racocetra fulgida TaxID=60492 RepID=A0A9N8W1U5_9GLOM|nr:7962_t:CDS:2 [Racocetra fulgida]
MRKKQVEQLMFKANEALNKFQATPFAGKSKSTPLPTPKTFGQLIGQYGTKVKKLEKLQEEEGNEEVVKTLKDLVDQIATIDSNFERIKKMNLENEEIRYIKNTDDALDIRPEQYINLKEPHRRAVMAKLTAIANTKDNKKTKRKTPIRHKHSDSNASMTSEARSSWSEDSAAEDKKFQEEQDKVIGQVLEQRDKNNSTRTLPITGEPSTKGNNVTLHNIQVLNLTLPTSKPAKKKPLLKTVVKDNAAKQITSQKQHENSEFYRNRQMSMEGRRSSIPPCVQIKESANQPQISPLSLGSAVSIAETTSSSSTSIKSTNSSEQPMQSNAGGKCVI